MNKAKIKNAAFAIVLISLFAVIASVLISRAAGDDFSVFGLKFYIIRSGSMSKSVHADADYKEHIQIDDVVVGKTVMNLSDIQKDDIITFRKNGVLITHRVIEVNGDGTFITQGDANQSADGILHYDDIVAKKIFIVPKIGLILRFMQSPIGICAGVVIIFIILGFNLLAGKAKKNTIKGIKALL